MKTVLFLILVFLFTSCAIHKSFPFICFKGSCIGKQWHFRDIKTAGKNIKVNANQRKKKRAANKRKRHGIEEKTESIETKESIKEIEKPDIVQQDSITSFKINFKGSDTLIVINYGIREDSISEDYQVVLKKYFKAHDFQNITEITLQEYTGSDNVSGLTQRMKILMRFFYELNIPKAIILVKSIKPINKEQPHITTEAIEIRIR
jgi:hypothetical protein